MGEACCFDGSGGMPIFLLLLLPPLPLLVWVGAAGEACCAEDGGVLTLPRLLLLIFLLLLLLPRPSLPLPLQLCLHRSRLGSYAQLLLLFQPLSLLRRRPLPLLLPSLQRQQLSALPVLPV